MIREQRWNNCLRDWHATHRYSNQPQYMC